AFVPLCLCAFVRWDCHRGSGEQVASSQDFRGRRCGGDLWRELRQSEQVAKQVASAPTTPSQPPRIHSEGSWPKRGRGKSRARALTHGCPMSRGVNEVNTESHRNRGLSIYNVWKSPRRDVIRSDGWLSHCVRSPDIGHPCWSRSPLRRRSLVRSTPERARGKSRARALRHDITSAPEDSLRGELARASKLRSRLRALKPSRSNTTRSRPAAIHSRRGRPERARAGTWWRL
ncbi:MAG: hypothetical protein RL591_2338, partial [Planctomycetota bacterium]